MHAIREAAKLDEEDEAKQLASIETCVNLSFDVKKNHILKILDDFNKRYLRLKIVQN